MNGHQTQSVYRIRLINHPHKKNKNSIDFHKFPCYPIRWQTRYKKMRIISKENKQVYTGIASALNQQKLHNRIMHIVVSEASEEIFSDKAI